MKRNLKSTICIVIFLSLMTGCAQKASKYKNQDSFAYAGQEALTEELSMEHWREMRRQSEVVETSESRWKYKAKPLTAVAASETKGRLKTNAAKGVKKPVGQNEKPDETAENASDLSAPK